MRWLGEHGVDDVDCYWKWLETALLVGVKPDEQLTATGGRRRHSAGMTRIDETRLPGLGIRHDFVTANGTRIGVITYRDGRREVVVFDERDPDECRASVHLDEDDAHVLADLLGGSQIIEHLEHERERPPT